MARVLVIEDDKFLRSMIINVLRKSEYQVSEAENGNEGLERIQEEGAPDVVLTDILMPDKEGLETISEIKSMYPRMVIIAMSGGGVNGNMMFLDMAQRVGAQKILKKPFKPQDLLEMLDEVIPRDGGAMTA